MRVSELTWPGGGYPVSEHGNDKHDATVLDTVEKIAGQNFLRGTTADQFLKIETKVIVGATVVGDQAAAITFDTPFPNACDGVWIMIGDQDVWALPAGYELGGISITGRTKNGFTCTFRWTATPGAAANIYFTVFAIGR